MSGARDRPFRLKLTVRQMMKLVAFSAVVSFCLRKGDGSKRHSQPN